MSTSDLIKQGMLMGTCHLLTGPDHLAAMATICGIYMQSNRSSGSSRFESFMLGIKWGIGNSIGLLIVGSIMITLQQGQTSRRRRKEDIEMDVWWSVLLDGMVGIMMIALGCLGLKKACRNRKGSIVTNSMPQLGVGKDDCKTKKDDEDTTYTSSDTCSIQIEVVKVPLKDPVEQEKQKQLLDDSISEKMEEILKDDASETNSRHSFLSEALSRVSENLLGEEESNGSYDEEEHVSENDLSARSNVSGRSLMDISDRSDSFKKYDANKPKVAKASSLLKKHVTSDTSIVSSSKIPSTKGFGLNHLSPNERRERAVGCLKSVSTISSALAFSYGFIQGLAGAGSMLGGMSASQLNDMSTALYLSTFCLTSTFISGGFTAFYDWLGRKGSSGKRIFMVEAGSAIVSVTVGVLYLALLWVGKMEELLMSYS